MFLKKRIYIYFIFLILSICISFGNSTSIPHVTKIRVSYLDLNVDSIFKRIVPIENTPTEVIYLKKMLPLARKKKNDKIECKLLYLISRNYFNCLDEDSLKYWVSLTTSTSLKKKQYIEYFDAYSLLCSFDIYNLNFERALDNANQLYAFAKRVKSNYGLISSYENIGIIYMETFRFGEAIKSFKEGYSLLKKEKKQNYSYNYQMLSYLIECDLKVKDYAKAEHRIDIMQKELEDWKKSERFVPYNRCKGLLTCYKIEMYVALNNREEAKKCVAEAEVFMKDVNDEYVYTLFNQSAASYFELVKDYSSASRYLDNVNYMDSYLPVMKMKAKILLESGKNKESAELYSNIVAQTDSIYNQNFASQLNKLRNTHEIDRLNLQNKELEIKARTTNFRIICVVAFLLLIITIISVMALLWMKKMKNELVKSEILLKAEKKELEQSQKELIIAKNKAEDSNKFKDTFLANMSHEVRTPLNAIVGFSGIISDMYSDNEDTKEFSALIKMNTDLLLKLINDTIDISLLQTNQLEFKLEQCELNGICISLVEQLKVRNNNNIDILFTPKDDKGYYFTTDVKRIQQLLMNLLINSLKFTDKGYIKLEYQIDKVDNNIIFIVEDTGKGISPNMQTKIFESFQKVNPFTQGIGLGLSLCKIIAQRLNGKLILDTTYTGGTRMIFIHPLI